MPESERDILNNSVESEAENNNSLAAGFNAPPFQLQLNPTAPVVVQQKNEGEENPEKLKDTKQELVYDGSDPNSPPNNPEKPISQAAPPPFQLKSNSSSSSMPGTTLEQMSGSFGHDFSDVNIHQGSQSAVDAGALAYTQGNDIHFAPGQYDPSSQTGQELLGHELTHVVQQREGRVQANNSVNGMPLNDDQGLEKEADDWGSKVSQFKTGPDPSESPHNMNSTQSAVMQQKVMQRVRQEAQDYWDSNKGDRAIASLKTMIDAWKAFRKSPDSFKNIPPATGVSKLSDLIQSYEAVEKGYKKELGEIAKGKLSTEEVASLSEMSGFNISVRVLSGVLPGFKSTDVKHKYSMESSEENVKETLVNKLVPLPVSYLKVSYSNSIGWTWKKNLIGSTITFGVGISIAGGGAKGKPVKGSPKAGMGLGMATISVNTKALANSSAYWGYENLPGLVTIASGPAVKLKLIGDAGLKASTGGLISLVGTGGPPGTLGFINPVTSLNGVVELYDKAENTKKGGRHSTKKVIVELEAKIAEMAGGMVASTSEKAEVNTPEMTEKIKDNEKKISTAISGFETGKAEIGPLAGTISNFSQKVRLMHGKIIDEISPDFQKLDEKKIPMDKQCYIDFNISGFASQKWSNSKGKNKTDLNKDLSQKRADEVSKFLQKEFVADFANYNANGLGEGVILYDDGEGDIVVAPEAQNKDKVNQLVDKKVAEYMEQNPKSTKAQAEEVIRKRMNLHKDANSASARLVVIEAVIKYKTVEFDSSPEVKDPAPT